MSDVLTSKQRSYCMSKISGKGNASTELRLIQIFKERKISGWRRNIPMFGKPDFVFPKLRVAVFVDGEFWHGHPTRANIPVNNREFWIKKIGANKTRDLLVTKTLRSQGWKVIRIWQHELSKKHEAKLARKLIPLTSVRNS